MACANPERVAEKEASSIAVSPDCKQFQPWYVCMQILIYQFNKVLPTFQSVSGDVPGIDCKSHSSHNSLPSVEFAPEVNNRKHNCAKCSHMHFTRAHTHTHNFTGKRPQNISSSLLSSSCSAPASLSTFSYAPSCLLHFATETHERYTRYRSKLRLEMRCRQFGFPSAFVPPLFAVSSLCYYTSFSLSHGRLLHPIMLHSNKLLLASQL